MNSVAESSFKDYKIKEAIKNITLVDDFENETRGKNQTNILFLHQIKSLYTFMRFLIVDSYDTMSVGGSDRHFKIKKKKSDIESLPKEEVINCACASNQEDGLMIQVIYV